MDSSLREFYILKKNFQLKQTSDWQWEKRRTKMRTNEKCSASTKKLAYIPYTVCTICPALCLTSVSDKTFDLPLPRS